MLDINPDTVCQLILLAREFHAQEQVVIPEEPGNPSGDWALQMLASHSDDSTLLQFQTIVNDLEPDQQLQLIALLWLGRNDVELDEWSWALAQAEDSGIKDTADYLICHPLLADYWQAALEIHGYACD